MEKKNILFDLDDTLTDYNYTNRYAVQCVFDVLHKPFDEEIYKDWLLYERAYYDKFEQNQSVTHTHGLSLIDYARSKIYMDYFYEDNIPLELGQYLMETYINNLGVINEVLPNSEEVLEYLYDSYNLFIASNGPTKSQYRKLINTGLDKYFKGVVSAEDAGYAKPKDKYFQYLFKVLELNPNETAFVGDSLTSDIIGANHNGLYSIWLNRQYKPNETDITPDVEIHDIKELKKIL